MKIRIVPNDKDGFDLLFNDKKLSSHKSLDLAFRRAFTLRKKGYSNEAKRD